MLGTPHDVYVTDRDWDGGEVVLRKAQVEIANVQDPHYWMAFVSSSEVNEFVSELLKARDKAWPKADSATD